MVRSKEELGEIGDKLHARTLLLIQQVDGGDVPPTG